ncbi:hypothetical protein BDK63_002465 [Halomonas campaniensis]|uniref:Uncharacterized protein n=1 Tax=Halomonas campaniensis TaxID=213554 RepID=A0A7W5PBG8_9GAMM|nr:hypothetical protein [Halomonas campaniensis]MBB3331582.1 hypothetical protein [Halomonas campaniensis]
MTYPIDTPRPPARAADAYRHAPASRYPGLIALLDRDDIVRPELRNDAILAALPGQAAPQRHRAASATPPAGR